MAFSVFTCPTLLWPWNDFRSPTSVWMGQVQWGHHTKLESSHIRWEDALHSQLAGLTLTITHFHVKILYGVQSTSTHKLWPANKSLHCKEDAYHMHHYISCKNQGLSSLFEKQTWQMKHKLSEVMIVSTIKSYTEENNSSPKNKKSKCLVDLHSKWDNKTLD